MRTTSDFSLVCPAAGRRGWLWTAVLVCALWMAAGVSAGAQTPVVIGRTAQKSAAVRSRASKNPATTRRRTAVSATAAPAAKRDEQVYEVVEQMPKFANGDAALMQYLNAETHYPAEAARQNVQGRVIVGFIVERDGSISNVKVLRSVEASLDTEAVRVVSSMPRWTPGRQNGRTVRVKFQVPVTFRLQ